LWCGKPTVKNRAKEGVEHMFPVAIGGRKTLPVGCVCKDCNGKLGCLDEYLKYGHESMMDAFQADDGITGRVRKDKMKRKALEKTYISGKGEAKKTRIERKGSDVYLVNASYYVTSDKFVRALHKCTANILCNEYGPATTRNSFESLLKYVSEGGDSRSWSYAVSFPNHFPPRSIITEPKPFIFTVNGEHVVGFLHTSGIWLTGSRPFSLNPSIIEIVSERIADKIGQDNATNSEQAISSFGFDYQLSKDRIHIDKLRFLWVT
jgi:hypothetical protein